MIWSSTKQRNGPPTASAGANHYQLQELARDSVESNWVWNIEETARDFEIPYLPLYMHASTQSNQDRRNVFLKWNHSRCNWACDWSLGN